MLHKTAEGFGVIPSELRVLFAQFASISVPKCHDRVQAFLERIIIIHVSKMKVGCIFEVALASIYLLVSEFYDDVGVRQSQI